MSCFWTSLKTNSIWTLCVSSLKCFLSCSLFYLGKPYTSFTDIFLKLKAIYLQQKCSLSIKNTVFSGNIWNPWISNYTLNSCLWKIITWSPVILPQACRCWAKGMRFWGTPIEIKVIDAHPPLIILLTRKHDFWHPMIYLALSTN